MKTIWKFPLKTFAPILEIEMPRNAKVLTVQVQKEIPCIWAIVEPQEKKETRKFRLLGTGHEFDIPIAQVKYIGTFQLQSGGFIGHLFETK